MKHGSDERIRVGIVSTDPLRVMGVQTILEDGDDGAQRHGPRFEVISLSAPNVLRTTGLEVVLIDSGATDHLLALIAGFRRDRPKLHVMVMGPESPYEPIEGVIGAGARGYLDHSASEDEVRLAVQTVWEGSMWASRKVMTRLLDEASDRVAEGRPRPTGFGGATAIYEVPKFTRREREVLTLLTQGYPNREIGSVMGVDEGTVKAHVGRLMRKMGVVNRTALTMLMLERHLC